MKNKGRGGDPRVSTASTERWQEVKAVLDAFDDAPPPDRKTLLRRCGGDEDLAAEVESLLAFEGKLDGFIDEPVISWAGEPQPKDTAPGRRIGPYRTVEVLGEGGMGIVYLARRESEFEQRVALKLVQRSLGTGEVIRRFENERQILARLEHPYIARIFDGGTDGDGLPYFVMELIEGEPIDRYCDARRLTTRRRLELFLKVCEALQFAHQHLVIHRDLKPRNILVDASGTPKLLDFGIAKLLRMEDPAPSARASPRGAGSLTQPGERPMSLWYASPEQVSGDPITAASDVYSLGVLLYKLLTGRLPYRTGTDGHPDPEAILTEVPARPSEAVFVSRTHDGTPGRPRRRLAGDLDAIVLKMLSKTPRERYGSVDQLASDIRRHLRDLPVRARDAAVIYRAGKFVRRNRWLLGTAVAFLLLVAGFTLALFAQLAESRRERDRAQRLSTLMENLFNAADPDRAAGRELTVRELLDLGRDSLEDGLHEEPEVRAQLLQTLGRVYSRLGHYDEARGLLHETVESLRLRDTRDRPELATAINDLALALYRTGRSREAEERFREAIAMRRRLGDEQNVLKPMNNLAAILLDRGELDEAEEIYRRSLEVRRRRFGDAHPNVATSLRSLASVLYERGELDEAEPYLREALEIRRDFYGDGDTRVASVWSLLGRVQHARGLHAEAEEIFERVLATRRERLGEDHLHVALTKKDLKSVALALGQVDRARGLLEEALELLRRKKPAGDWNIADAESVYGACLAAQGRYEEAAPLLMSGHRVLAEVKGDQNIFTRQARRRLDELNKARDQAARDVALRSTPPR